MESTELFLRFRQNLNVFYSRPMHPFKLYFCLLNIRVYLKKLSAAIMSKSHRSVSRESHNRLEIF